MKSLGAISAAAQGSVFRAVGELDEVFAAFVSEGCACSPVLVGPGDCLAGFEFLERFVEFDRE